MNTVPTYSTKFVQGLFDAILSAVFFYLDSISTVAFVMMVDVGGKEPNVFFSLSFVYDQYFFNLLGEFFFYNDRKNKYFFFTLFLSKRRRHHHCEWIALVIAVQNIYRQQICFNTSALTETESEA